jgi:hypothetical protein
MAGTSLTGIHPTIANLYVREIDSSNSNLIVSGDVTGVWSDATAATYSKGCQLTQTDASAGVSGIWVNVGTPTSPVWQMSTAGNGLITVGTLTAAQIKTLNSVPTTIIAAPGANKALVITQATFQIIPTATTYTSGGVVSLVYHGGSTNLMAGNLTAGFVTSSTGLVQTVDVAAGPTSVSTNSGIDISCATGDFATGTGTLKYSVATTTINLS